MLSAESFFGHRSETPNQRLRRLLLPPTSPFTMTAPQPHAVSAPPAYTAFPQHPYSYPYPQDANAAAQAAQVAAAATSPFTNPFAAAQTADISPQDLWFLYKTGQRHRRDAFGRGDALGGDVLTRAMTGQTSRMQQLYAHWTQRLLDAETQRSHWQGKAEVMERQMEWMRQVVLALLAGGGPGPRPPPGAGRNRMPRGPGPSGGGPRSAWARGLGDGPADYDEGDEEDDDDVPWVTAQRRRRAAAPRPRPPVRFAGDRRHSSDDEERKRGRGRRGPDAERQTTFRSFSRRRTPERSGEAGRDAFFDHRRGEGSNDDDDSWERYRSSSQRQRRERSSGRRQDSFFDRRGRDEGNDEGDDGWERILPGSTARDRDAERRMSGAWRHVNAGDRYRESSDERRRDGSDDDRLGGSGRRRRPSL